MKLRRDQLKALVKECLVEILTEGVGNRLVEAAERSPIRGSAQARPARSHDPSLDRRALPSPALQEAIKVESGGNPVMADILSDTAARTIPAQAAAERRGAAVNPGLVESVVADLEPEQIFGEEAPSKWAELAFSSPAPKR